MGRRTRGRAEPDRDDERHAVGVRSAREAGVNGLATPAWHLGGDGGVGTAIVPSIGQLRHLGAATGA